MTDRLRPDPLPRPVLVAGLTGGIAAGKSTVAGMFRELGAAVVDADGIVHDLLGPGGAAVPAIVATWGRGVLLPEGGIDRARLAEIVFGDDGERRRLEEIVHPMVVEESRRRIAELAKATGTDVILYDAALLVETGRHDQFDRLVVVVAAPEVQLRRLMERDRIGADAAGARIRAQLPQDRKAAVADYVIDNSGPWHETRKRVAEVYRDLREDARLLREGKPLPLRA